MMDSGSRAVLRGDGEAVLTPFLDFLLLTLCALLAIQANRVRLEALELDVPEVGGDGTVVVSTLDQVMVELTADGQIFVDGVEVEVEDLASVIGANGQPDVLLRVDSTVDSGMTLDRLSRIQPHVATVKVQVASAAEER